MREDDSVQPLIITSQEFGAELADGLWGVQVCIFHEYVFVLRFFAQSRYEQGDSGMLERMWGYCNDVGSSLGKVGNHCESERSERSLKSLRQDNSAE